MRERRPRNILLFCNFKQHFGETFSLFEWGPNIPWLLRVRCCECQSTKYLGTLSIPMVQLFCYNLLGLYLHFQVFEENGILIQIDHTHFTQDTTYRWNSRTTGMKSSLYILFFHPSVSSYPLNKTIIVLGTYL